MRSLSIISFKTRKNLMQKLSSKVYLSHQHWHTSFCILVVLRSLNIVIITPVTIQNDLRSRGQKPCLVRKVQILLLLFKNTTSFGTKSEVSNN